MISAGGIGDCLLAFQCGNFVKEDVKYVFFVREEVFNPLKYLFPEENVHREEESESCLANFNFREKYPEYSEIYFNNPDSLFSNSNSFDFKKYSTNPSVIKSLRLLLNETKNEKVIYVGLNSVIENYLYREVNELLFLLANTLKDYTIYYPNLTKWNNIKINKPILQLSIPSNLIIKEDPQIEEEIEVLRKSSYFIGTDNGFSHLAYHMGKPRLLLDPQYNKMPWVARWREDVSESIPISCGFPDVVSVVKTNIEKPYTLLIPRSTILSNPNNNWKTFLLNKFDNE